MGRMLSEEHAPPGLLAGVEPESLKFAVAPTPEQRRDLHLAIAEARRPLAQRLDRVAARLVSATARPDVTYRLDARMRLNAGAELGFGSHRILVGPSLVLLAESEDALAFVLGHELAHIVHHHTKFKALQDLFVWVVTLGQATGRTGETISGILSQGGTAAINRDKECEADYYALQYMHGAEYRPEAAVEFWKLMLALRPTTSRQWVPFVSGYPPEAERVLRLARWAELDLLHGPSTGSLADVRSCEGAGPATVQDLSPEDAIESFGLVLE
ncbi:MAG: M48 family metalloprotease [Deltaproteobacteria bacterium]|nr:M48 family metalloprotease [Deltaproteobacteria bacterium]